MKEKPDLIKILLPFFILIGILIFTQGSVALIDELFRNPIYFILLCIVFILFLGYYFFSLNWGEKEKYKNPIIYSLVIILVLSSIFYFLNIAHYFYQEIIVEQNKRYRNSIIALVLLYLITYIFYRLRKYKREYPENTVSKLIFKISNQLFIFLLFGFWLILPIYLILTTTDSRAILLSIILLLSFSFVVFSIGLSKFKKKGNK